MDEFEQKLELFENECRLLKITHFGYTKSVDKMKEEQAKCLKSVHHCRTFMKILQSDIASLKKSAVGDAKSRLKVVESELQKKDFMFRDLEDTLPRSTGMYLRVVLGSIDISFSSKQDKFEYKNDYEHFKMVVSAISAVFTFILYFFIQNRVLDALFHSLLVWYYCTLTIRERILIANGSRIKGWWNIYHFFSTAYAGIMLIWPASRSYDEFRDQFMLSSLYMNIVHCVQYHYQTMSLYKLKALGDRHPMDITVDGFMSWMFRQLTFLLPFLFLAYAFELANAYKLYLISREDYCHEWQVSAVALIYLIVSAGNIITVCLVIKQKLLAPAPPSLRDHLRKKYSFCPPVDMDSCTDLFAPNAGDHGDH